MLFFGGLKHADVAVLAVARLPGSYRHQQLKQHFIYGQAVQQGVFWASLQLVSQERHPRLWQNRQPEVLILQTSWPYCLCLHCQYCAGLAAAVLHCSCDASRELGGSYRGNAACQGL